MHLDQLEIVSEWVQQVKPLAVRHGDRLADRGPVALQIAANRREILDLESNVPIFGRLHPRRAEIEVQQDVQELEPHQVIAAGRGISSRPSRPP